MGGGKKKIYLKGFPIRKTMLRVFLKNDSAAIRKVGKGCFEQIACTRQTFLPFLTGTAVVFVGGTFEVAAAEDLGLGAHGADR